jgi:arylsulfatase A-like enzyme
MECGAEDKPAPSRLRRHRLLSRVFSRPIEQTHRPEARLSALAVWGLCSWIGLACGLIESVLQLVWRRFEHQLANPDLWVNWHEPWLAPLSLSTLFLGLGLLIGLTRGIAPRISTRLLPHALVGLGTWSILGVLPRMNPWAMGFLVVAVAYRVGRHARFDSERFRGFARASLPAMAASWLVLFVATGVVPSVSEAWSLRAGPSPPKGAPNVLLVVLDTVRADNLSLQGYERATSPRLAEWARRGVRFDQARATTPYTLGTHASLFTGYWASETSARVNAPLDGRRLTIAEHLRDRGYATGGFVGNVFYGSAHYGLDRGFLHYQDVAGNMTRRVTPREFLRSCRLGESLLLWFELKWRIFFPMERLRLDADELNREALAWVETTLQHDRPFFLFLNYFDAHSPYSLPGFAPQPYSRLPARSLEARMKLLESAEERQEARPSPADDAEVARLQPEVNGHLRDAYDDGIAWIDRKLDELLRTLEGRGLLANTLIVVTADHGEMLGEHEVIGHGKSLHRQVVHVPLIVVDPRGSRSPRNLAIHQPVSLRDVPATILDLIGDPAVGQFPGQSLSRFWSKSTAANAVDGPVLSEMEHLFWKPHTHRLPAASGKLWLLTEGRWSYHRLDQETLGAQEHLFDLVEDPGETHDLAADPAYGVTLGTLRKRFDAVRPVGSGG